MRISPVQKDVEYCAGEPEDSRLWKIEIGSIDGLTDIACCTFEGDVSKS